MLFSSNDLELLTSPHVFLYTRSEFDSAQQIFVNAYPWLFPCGIGDVYDEKRGKVEDIHAWAKHMLRYHDGRFINDQMFSLYVLNMLQRHTNNTQGNYFCRNENFLDAPSRLPPTVEDLKDQVANGDYTYIKKLLLSGKGYTWIGQLLEGQNGGVGVMDRFPYIERAWSTHSFCQVVLCRELVARPAKTHDRAGEGGWSVRAC